MFNKESQIDQEVDAEPFCLVQVQLNLSCFHMNTGRGAAVAQGEERSSDTWKVSGMIADTCRSVLGQYTDLHVASDASTDV